MTTKKDLLSRFKAPPAEARPFVRWWWNNNQVEQDELLRELDVLAKAGIGGVEVNPILDPHMSWNKVSLSRAKILPWRSREWDEALLAVAEAARKKDMLVDLIGGSSWPFGGKFLRPEEQVRRLSAFREEVSGPCSFELKITDLFQRPRDYGYHRARKVPENPTLNHVWLYPKQLDSLAGIREIPGAAGKDGIIRVDVPEGEHIIAFGIEEWGFRKLGNGVPGADGPALDHFNARALETFMNQVLGISETWGEPLSKYIRAIFCDSIEMGEANWSHDMMDSFQKRKGYDLSLYLPIILRDEDDSIEMPVSLRETFRRVRYDWIEHNAHLFHERFTSEFCRICHEKGLLARYQPQGNPFLMDMASGAMLPDIPEGEIWLYSSDPYENDHFTWNQHHGGPIWIKYASAGARLSGRKIVSYEAMTNVLGVFRATLASIKQASDMALVCGATHGVLHGYNYSPPDVPFPGIVRFGTYFSEHNTWWPWFRHWTKYIARLNAVFQASEPMAEFALLGPTPDIWGTVGLSKDPFHMAPVYFHRLWEAISQIGSTCDYLNPAVVAKAEAVERSLAYGPMKYRLLLVCEMEAIPVETAEAIARLAEAGVQIVFVGTLPHRAPGLCETTEDARVSGAIEASLRAGALRVEAPSRDQREWLKSILKSCAFNPGLRIESPHDSLYFQRYHHAGRDILFFTNTSRTRSRKSFVRFPCHNKQLERWDAESGRINPFPASNCGSGFTLELEPLQSALIVAQDGTPLTGSTVNTRKSSRPSPLNISQPWDLEFQPVEGQPPFTARFDVLQEFSTHPDERIRSFSGKVVYRTEFSLADTGFERLDLGNINDFICEVELNGHKVGTILFGHRPVKIKDTLKPGPNRLCITYTTTLWNHMRGTKWAPFWFGNFQREIPEAVPSGILGPVRLLD